MHEWTRAIGYSLLNLELYQLFIYLFSQLICRRICFPLVLLDFSFCVNVVLFEQRSNLYLEFFITQMNNLKCIKSPEETLISASPTRPKHFIYFYFGQVAILLFSSRQTSLILAIKNSQNPYSVLKLYIGFNAKYLFKARVLSKIIALIWVQ